jgi:hypothetical protein
MPAYAQRSRAALLAMSTPLVAAARELFTTATVLDAAAAAEEAAIALNLEVSGRLVVSARLSAEVAAVIEAEASLDRRVGGLHRALEGLIALGLGAAEDLKEQLFPAGLAAVTGPSGRAQVPLYSRLADSLTEAHDAPGAERLQPMLDELRDDLRAWCAATLAKDSTHRVGSTRAAGASAATDALRAALTRLDRLVELEAGGASGDAYQRWAMVARGIA